MLDGVIKVGKIDKKLIPSLKIEKSPTYIFTRSSEPQNSKQFKGKFNKKDVSAFCLEQLAAFIKARENKTPDSSEKASSKGSSNSGSSSSSQGSSHSGSVIELTDKDFEQKVLKSNDAWLVEFYSPGVLFPLFSVATAEISSLNTASFRSLLEKECTSRVLTEVRTSSSWASIRLKASRLFSSSILRTKTSPFLSVEKGLPRR